MCLSGWNVRKPIFFGFFERGYDLQIMGALRFLVRGTVVRRIDFGV